MSDNWPMRFEISINNQTDETLIHSNQGVFGKCSEDPNATECESRFTLAPNHVIWDQPDQIQAYIERAHHQSVHMQSLKDKAMTIGRSARHMLEAANIFLAGADDPYSKSVLSGYEVSAKCLTSDSLSWDECPEIVVGIKERPSQAGLDGVDTFWDFAYSTIHIVK